MHKLIGVYVMKPIDTAIKTALEETKILLLGSQVFLGFEFLSFFQKNFSLLPVVSQYVKLFSLMSVLIAVFLFLLPAVYLRIVLKGKVTKKFATFISRVTSFGLFFFALGIAGEVYVAVSALSDEIWGVIAVEAVLVAAFGLWYGIDEIIEFFLPKKKGVYAAAKKQTEKK